MAPKSKKSSYAIFGDVFNLTRWNGVVRLNERPQLTHRSNDHLLENARTGLVSFSNFSHFLILLWYSILICFWTYKCLDFVVGRSRWKPDTLGVVGTCLGWVLIKVLLKLSKKTFYLCSCVHRYRLVYIAFIHAYPYITHAYTSMFFSYTDAWSNLYFDFLTPFQLIFSYDYHFNSLFSSFYRLFPLS